MDLIQDLATTVAKFTYKILTVAATNLPMLILSTYRLLLLLLLLLLFLRRYALGLAGPSTAI